MQFGQVSTKRKRNVKLSPPILQDIWFSCCQVCILTNQIACCREGVNEIIYDDILQNNLVQAQYWHDPLDQDKYVKYSQFIAEINGEGINPNATYVENLMKLEKMVLVMFSGVSLAY